MTLGDLTHRHIGQRVAMNEFAGILLRVSHDDRTTTITLAFGHSTPEERAKLAFGAGGTYVLAPSTPCTVTPLGVKA